MVFSKVSWIDPTEAGIGTVESFGNMTPEELEQIRESTSEFKFHRVPTKPKSNSTRRCRE